MQPSADGFGVGNDAPGEDGQQIGRRKRDAGERAENRFCRLSPDDTFVARQEQHRLLASCREDEPGWTEGRDRLESHGGRALEARNETTTETSTAGSPAQA